MQNTTCVAVPCVGPWTRSNRRGAGFSLVELLVVVGIITVLISMLIPALVRAREQANCAKCLASLRSMHQAAEMHALDHEGFMPAAGTFLQHNLGIDSTPQGLGDPQMKRYIYYTDPPQHRLISLPAALAPYLGVRSRADGLFEVATFLSRDEVRRRFQCPAQSPDSVIPGYTVTDGNSGSSQKCYMSYVFNAAFLGRVKNPYGMSPTGQLSRVHRPADVFLFADGNPTQMDGGGSYAVSDAYTAEETMVDVLWPHLGLDFARHHGRINVIFLDGHAASLSLPPTPSTSFTLPGNQGDLPLIGVSKGIYD